MMDDRTATWCSLKISYNFKINVLEDINIFNTKILIVIYIWVFPQFYETTTEG